MKKQQKKTWRRGRKAVTEEPLVRVQLKLAESDRDWLKAHGEISTQIRALIDQARQAEDAPLINTKAVTAPAVSCYSALTSAKETAMNSEQQLRYDLTKLCLENRINYQVIPFVVTFLRDWILDGRDTLARRTPDTAQTNTPDSSAPAQAQQ